MQPKCPKCEKSMLNLRASRQNISMSMNVPEYYTITLQCPHCNTALGAQIDPMVQAQLVADALKKTR